MKPIIYHNPRCTKSREALAWLEANGHEPVIVRYLDEALTYEVLDALLQTMDMDPRALIRSNEADWKSHFADAELGDEELIYAMIEYPKLMQRPIVSWKNKAAVGRPLEAIKALF
ncbi:MAG: arsenate reductase (glutaredoxin) [Bacteroidetes bacterium]|nr:arsenate reductase (glutaredoxin) [Bacteroidota bacterium]